MNKIESQQLDDILYELHTQQSLDDIIHSIHEAEEFHALIPRIQGALLKLLNAERFSVYYLSKNKTLISQFNAGCDVKRFTLSPSTSSIAGFVALSQRNILIKNVYDKVELQKLHANIKFNQSIDKQYGITSRAMIVVPILVGKVLLGVLQVINNKSGLDFSEQDLKKTILIASLLGQKFQLSFNVTSAPFELLLRHDLITTKQLNQCSDQAKELNMSLAHFLMTEQKINAEEVRKSLENYYQKPYQAYDSSLHVRYDLIKKIKKSYLYANSWVPVVDESENLFILIDDPTDNKRIMEMQQLLDLDEYHFHISTPEDIRQLIEHGIMATNALDPQQRDADQLITELQQKEEDENELIASELAIEEAIESEEPIIIRLINQIIRDAVKAQASDIHIEPGLANTTSSVRFRIDGVCIQKLSIPSSHQQAVVSRIKIISNLDISERRLPQDGKCVMHNKGKRIELRVATIPTVNGEGVVMRILNTNKPLPLDQLNLSNYNLTHTQQLLTRPHGIFLVVGPTGSGKTTTLHALLAHINTEDRKIWTAEDPVEITHAGLQQLQINHKIGLTFATALRSFLRADPDVIMIGEMRDQETAQIAIEASLTGHLVFSTLHTNSAPETITRLLDLGMDPINFSDALLGILAQRLVRTLCEKCKQKEPVNDKEIAFLKEYDSKKQFNKPNVDFNSLEFHHAVGCKACNQTGYKGRTGVHGLLVATPEIKEAIYKRHSLNDILQLIEQQGMHSLMDDGVQKLLAGQTDLEQIKRLAVH